jgi:hypothetical protein
MRAADQSTLAKFGPIWYLRARVKLVDAPLEDGRAARSIARSAQSYPGSAHVPSSGDRPRTELSAPQTTERPDDTQACAGFVPPARHPLLSQDSRIHLFGGTPNCRERRRADPPCTSPIYVSAQGEVRVEPSAEIALVCNRWDLSYERTDGTSRPTAA